MAQISADDDQAEIQATTLPPICEHLHRGHENEPESRDDKGRPSAARQRWESHAAEDSGISAGGPDNNNVTTDNGSQLFTA